MIFLFRKQSWQAREWFEDREAQLYLNLVFTLTWFIHSENVTSDSGNGLTQSMHQGIIWTIANKIYSLMSDKKINQNVDLFFRVNQHFPILVKIWNFISFDDEGLTCNWSMWTKRIHSISEFNTQNYLDNDFNMYIWNLKSNICKFLC